MNTINKHASRLTARIAPYLDAIREARSAGLTWKDVSRLLGTDNHDQLRWAVKTCKYQVKQLPLPEPPPKALPPPATTAQPGTTRQNTKEFLASLEQIGGNKK